jgi:hypothetical protein
LSELHALLIGIDDYFPDRLPDGTRYPSLQGATGDVMRVGNLLLEQAGLSPEKLRILISRRGEGGQPTEPPPLRPTYQNMVAAFRRLAEEAKAGDRVYIHYSGHGARTPTEYPGIKGRMARDEALVPCDIGAPGSRYLRDLELATLVQLLVQRELLVTLVLDCCHAGGAMRSRAVARGVPWADLDPAPSAVADPETMTRIWGPARMEEVAYRGLSLQSWNALSKGYALFAACRPDETAFEYPFDKREPQGALTYWLLDTLRRHGLEWSCGEIHQRLLARIRGHLVHQTPVFLGDGERPFLGPGRAVMRAAVRALRAPGDGQVLIDVGRALGVRPGDRYELPDGLYEARQVGATETWVEKVKAFQGGRPVEPGEQVEVLPLRSAIHLAPPEPGDACAERALTRLRDLLRDSRFFEVEGDGTTADLRVAIDGQGSYEIQAPSGLAFPNLRPLPAKSPGAARELVRRLEHLTRFRNILEVDNPNPPDWLRIGLEVIREESPAEPVATRSIDLRVGDGMNLRIVNRSTLRLDFTVLDLQPDYGVSQLLPSRASMSLLPLDPGEVKIVRIKAWLPPGIEEGTDVLKVFATRGAVSFRWLELAPLCKPDQAAVLRGTPKNPLEKLFAQLAGTAPAKRGLTPSEFPEEEWLTAQMEVRVRR